MLCRAKELDQYLHDPTVPDGRKEQKLNQLRRSEAHYLRFLRTKEKVNNFQTIRVIGKGAFGEVRLVQHKSDSKIYALKSLVKTEMVRKELIHLLESAFLCSTTAVRYLPFHHGD